MNDKANDLAKRVRGFSGEFISFVEKLSDAEWKKKCDWEEWSVGVTARHVGASHFDIVDLTKMIVDGQKLPELTLDQIKEMANQHAREHADCTKNEVLDILKTKGAELVDFIAGLSDEELGRSAYFAATKDIITARQWIEFLIFQSATEHFAHMKEAVRG